MNDTSVEVTAGLGGFLVVFALAVAVWFLGRDLTRRLRRMRFAEQQRLDALAQEQAEAEAGSAATAEDPDEGPRQDPLA